MACFICFLLGFEKHVYKMLFIEKCSVFHEMFYNELFMQSIPVSKMFSKEPNAEGR